MILTDALGRRLELASPPQRIVSLVPSLTEWLFTIGAGERVVGITDYCIEPAAALAGLPRIRGTKNPDRAAISALRPDLVLADQEENRERDVLALSLAGIPVYVTAMRRVADVPAQLAALAAALGVSAQAAPGLDVLRAMISVAGRTAGRRRIKTIAFIWRDPWMVVAAETYAGDLLRICGAENLALQLPGRYPRAALDDFMALRPELILLPSEPYPFAAHDLDALLPYADVPAVRNKRIILCDGIALTWPGPRTADALRSFAGLIGAMDITPSSS
ncbi:MAG: ABC transporter substrate-binding protein [Chloroflexales bacterium]|nr:ABC transporter substrate-binding protein [Chloroflexales bacterium]